ncbi:MAG: D-alanine--D-alanine ligase [candidate division KSB1 bacterium]|nr:D-alanine--D-alanine ligase [candidate division KSB1 bacterium]MDZ7302888.1 D-alanine--D-alanine ligase [candidate division KSB1 bacterium]MDZ7310464.1 D-alanine--D-alanine ligase [candidate division KSB1 bacterium]
MKKLRVCVIFGGRSGEHEVSIVSATSVMSALDKSKYEVIPVGITKSGRWIAGEKAIHLLKSGIEDTPFYAMLPADPNEQKLLPTSINTVDARELDSLGEKFDIVFPVLHGPYGEDGTVQGLLELANLPYVGAGVLGSAVCMDKVVQKYLCAQAGVPVVPFYWLFYQDWQHGKTNMKNDSHAAANPQQLCGLTQAEMLARIETELELPVFIKPANMGSSVGITKAHNRDELIGGIEEAAQYDHKILIEVAVPEAREIEVSVLGNTQPKASVAGEVIPSNEFYDYDAKYVDGKSTLVIPADLPQELADAIRETAIRGFLACSCEGMARVDFLLERQTNRFYLNEINTIPGFTQISMYPKLWEATGVPYSQLLDELIQLAIERHQRKNSLRTSYQPKKEWYK